jgi:hypothetical protein
VIKSNVQDKICNFNTNHFKSSVREFSGLGTVEAEVLFAAVQPSPKKIVDELVFGDYLDDHLQACREAVLGQMKACRLAVFDFALGKIKNHWSDIHTYGK